MDTEHWRLRLMELHRWSKLTQAAFGAKLDLAPTYVSRLFYPPGKKGRKLIGLQVLLAARKAFNLSPDWHEQPVGTPFAGPPSPTRPLAPQMHVSEAVGVYKSPQVVWPFTRVPYVRLTSLIDRLGPQLGRELVAVLDQQIEATVFLWENKPRAGGKRRSAVIYSWPLAPVHR